ncbi:hypothetical protein E3T61_03100 [Cryobacterium lactosi]|uniref:DNA-binding protein n=1 Tax=Cryobacterium lactosi TaxID=1259202 RepID=A0A4R9BZ38_9MICO|nr:hypothetical protein [Cryobacterium lactosi]TFD94000.1 hypothetical protein E3T61_03100 [Cryobacterium lactosi]
MTAMVQVMDAGRGGRPAPGFRRQRVSSGEVAAALGKELNTVGQTRDRIIRKGIVHAPQYGALEFSVPGFAEYVRRRAAAADL